MMTNVMVRACLNQQIKNFEFDSGKMLKITHVRDRNLTESRISPKAEFHRKPNFSESRIYTKAEFIRKPNLSESRMFRSSEVWIEHTTL